MKKTISINISGILFSIEEDGYERLKNYLDEIKRYFARYDDTGEISADIENRVAEIFSAKLSGAKQVITASDVESLIVQMGNVADFEAVEEPQDASEAGAESAYSRQTTTGTVPPAAETSRRFFRDGNRKIIAGVAAGIGNYLRVDPFWIRLLFVIILFDLFLTFSFSSALLIGYVIIWLIVPEHYDLQEDRKIKKMYRDPDNKVIGGVSSGLAAYFGIDSTLIRILFIITAFIGGSGILAYIIMWIITPEARTLTDKMQMQGEPVTLSNIEHNIKKNLNIGEGENENIFVKILLFPFRLIAAVFSGGSRALNPLLRFLGDAIRVIAGLILILAGFFTLVAFIAVLAVYAGINPDLNLTLGDIEYPAALIQNTIPWITALAAFLSLAIPALLVVIMGISLLRRHWSLPRFASIAFISLWIISLVAAAITIPGIAFNFQDRDYVEKEYTYTADTAQVIRIGLLNSKGRYPDDVDLTIKGTPDSLLRLETRSYARGRSSDEALENARQISYPAEWQDSVLLLGRHIELDKDAPFRAQTLKATLYVPYEQKFTMDYGLRHILYYTLTPFGYNVQDLRNNTWQFNNEGELRCLECPAPEEKTLSDNGGISWDADLSERADDNARKFGFRDFSEIEAGSNFRLIIRQSDRFEVAAEGDEDEIEHLAFEQRGETLRLNYENNRWFRNPEEEVTVFISLPSLERLELSGAAEARTGQLRGDRLEVEMSGASQLALDAEYEHLGIDLSGASDARLQGRSRRLSADLGGASELRAYEFRVSEAQLELSGASEAEVNVRDRLQVDAGGGSEVRYRGKPEMRIDRSGGASIHQTRD